jgi:hypothetical protein
MKILGVMTENFSVYYDLVKALKDSKTPFTSLSFNDKIPANIGLIITTEQEKTKFKFEPVLTVSDNDDFSLLIDKAIKIIQGKKSFRTFIVGIDPGKRPGVAVLGDGEILNVYQPATPEDVVQIIKQVKRTYPNQELLIRIGHGAPTQRNRIINALFNLGQTMELVDESHTTQKTQQPDIKAAIDIAHSHGVKIKTRYEIKPTAGEIRDIQRNSRMESKGAITISKPLAEKVASGELTLEEAVDFQRSKNNSQRK